MLKIVADKDIPFLRGVLEPYAEIKYLKGGEISRDSVKDADALIIRTRTKCTPELLKGSPVKFIGTATIGFDHIDTQWCESNNIKWINAPGCNSSSVRQYIAAALLKLSQEFRFSLKDKTIGIVGAGNVGTKVISFCRLMGMKVLVNDPPRARREGNEGFTELDTLLAESDIVSLHVPLAVVGDDKTYHLVNEKSIRKMKRGAWLINTSRGEVADSGSLKIALGAGRLGGMIADVWEHEPDIDLTLMQMCFLATPHIAGYSTDGKANGTSVIVNCLAKFFDIPLKEWFPDQIPPPFNPVVSINPKSRNVEEIVREAVGHTYNISEDDLRLRFSPSDFEKQRGEYPVRREFHAYNVILTGGNRKTTDLLKQIGFKNDD